MRFFETSFEQYFKLIFLAQQLKESTNNQENEFILSNKNRRSTKRKSETKRRNSTIRLLSEPKKNFCQINLKECGTQVNYLYF